VLPESRLPSQASPSTIAISTRREAFFVCLSCSGPKGALEAEVIVGGEAILRGLDRIGVGEADDVERTARVRLLDDRHDAVKAALAGDLERALAAVEEHIALDHDVDVVTDLLGAHAFDPVELLGGALAHRRRGDGSSRQFGRGLLGGARALLSGATGFFALLECTAAIVELRLQRIDLGGAGLLLLPFAADHGQQRHGDPGHHELRHP